MFKKIIFPVLLFTICSCGNDNYYEDIGIPAKQSKKGDYGIVNFKGELLVDFEIDYRPSLMVEHIAHYKNNEEKIVFVDNEGRETKTDYVEALHFNEGKALVRLESGKLAFIDKNFETVLVLDDVEAASDFSEGLFKFKNEDNLWGFKDELGATIIKPRYSLVNNFSESLALVTNTTEETKQLGFINKDGTLVFPYTDDYYAIGNFHNGLAIYKNDDDSGYLDANFEEVIKNSDWDEIYPFFDGHATVKGDDREFGYIDKKGNYIIKTREKFPIQYYNDLAIFVSDQRKGGYMDKDRDIVIRAEYNELLPFFSYGAFAKDGTNWTYINTDGKDVKLEKPLDIKYLYHEAFLESVFKNNFPIDLEKTLSSTFYDVEAVYTFFLENENGILHNDKVIGVSGYLESVYKNHLEEDVYTSKITEGTLISTIRSTDKTIDSYKLFNTYLDYDKNFQFSIRHRFKDKILTNNEDVLEINDTNFLQSVRLKLRLKQKAKGKGKDVVEKLQKLFEENNFTYNEKEKVYANSDETKTISISRSYNDITMILKFLE